MYLCMCVCVCLCVAESQTTEVILLFGKYENLHNIELHNWGEGEV